VDFTVEGTTIHVASIASGYRAKDLAAARDPAVLLHCAFAARFAGGIGPPR
jgi:hypothetical protein